MSMYTVKVGESIGDVVENATGSLANWNAVLSANAFEDWTPDLVPGQQVVIPDSTVVQDLNTKRQLAVYPACNASYNDVFEQIITLFNLFNNNWILQTGFWNDNSVWVDGKNWID